MSNDVSQLSEVVVTGYSTRNNADTEDTDYVHRAKERILQLPKKFDIHILTGQAEAFDKFINQDDYLSTRRGQYAERYGALTPWRGKWDVKIMQDYNFKVSSASDKKNTIQLSIDILNFGNLLNSDWGLVQVPTSVQPIGVTVTGTTPTYTFDGTQKKTFNYDASLASRWQAQFGVRYIF